MGRSNSAAMGNGSAKAMLTAFVVRQALALAGFAIFLGLALAVAALATWNVADPSFSYATDNQPTNLLGYAGAAFADLMMQFLGLASLVALLPMLAFALALISGRRFNRLPARFAAWGGGTLLAAASLGCFPAPFTWPIPNGIGGVIGDMILRFPALFVGAYPTGMLATILGVVFAVPAVSLLLFGSGLVGEAFEDQDDEDRVPVAAPAARGRSAVDDEEDDEDSAFAGFLALGALAHYWYIAQARTRRLFGIKRTSRDTFDQPYDFNDDEFGTLNEPARPKTASAGHRVEPSLDGPAEGLSRRSIVAPPMAHDDDEGDFDDGVRPAGILPEDDDVPFAVSRPVAPGAARVQPRVVAPPPPPKPGARVAREAQGSFIDRDGFQLPSVHLLAEPKAVARDATLSAEVLEQNARMLEGVLED
ncbi:MAG: DNA translocase FtsK 4TM domain-containing protein, partial [Pseudorhizobium sp.]